MPRHKAVVLSALCWSVLVISMAMSSTDAQTGKSARQCTSIRPDEVIRCGDYEREACEELDCCYEEQADGFFRCFHGRQTLDKICLNCRGPATAVTAISVATMPPATPPATTTPVPTTTTTTTTTAATTANPVLRCLEPPSARIYPAVSYTNTNSPVDPELPQYLFQGQYLLAGGRIMSAVWIGVPSNIATLQLTSDGDLVARCRTQELWSTRPQTQGRGKMAVMRYTGALEVLDANCAVLWTSRTAPSAFGQTVTGVPKPGSAAYLTYSAESGGYYHLSVMASANTRTWVVPTKELCWH